ncbi:riboflavin synthase [Trichonephila clavata]|uniref:Riboflavin synthase n=1 Tax=Trichonephila clavata TaxID=2740835 RepID=A0A8X6IU60_TRICU|nr:riboflavin synthase [Trichonephila clavata]
MHNSDIETDNKYKIEDLPKSFKERSKNISKAFSSKIIKISTIRSRSIESNIQEFSFELTATGKDTFNTRPFQIKSLIDFFKICLSREKNFTVNIKVPKESEKLYNNYHKANKTVEEFISNAPIQILLQGITITLQTDVKNINLGSLQQIEIFLDEQLKYLEEAKSEEQSQDTLQVEETENKNENVVEKRNTQDKQIVQGSFGYNIASNRKQITRAPVIVAAMYENVSWFRSLFHLPNFVDKTQCFSPQLPKFFIQSKNMPSGVIPALDQAEKEPVSATQITEDSIGNLAPQKTEQNIGQTRSHTDYFKANRKKKPKKQATELSEEEKQSTIKRAQLDARVAMIDNLAEHKEKKLDEIFIEVMNGYKNQDPEIFHNIFNSVFNIVYFQDKQLHEILESGIITDIGTITDTTTHPNSDQIFHIKTQNLSSISKGDSIACSGVCLTVVDIMSDIFTVQVSQETMKVANSNTWKIGKKINLEQAMRLSDKIDGHLVQGHVDGIVKILTIERNLDSHEIKLSCPQELIKFVAKKGSVTLNGVSLTVNSVITRPLSKFVCGEKFLGEAQASTAEYLNVFEEHSQALTTKLPSEIEFQKGSAEFTVNIIPYTWENTTFQYNKINDYLNLEIDMIARYLDQLMQHKYN